MKKPAAIVVGSGLNGLGVVRSLAPEGVPITVIDEKPGGPACNSRFARPHFFERGPGATDGLVDAILKLAEATDQPPVLFVTQEAAVARLSEERDRLEGKVRHIWAARDTLADLMDKRRFHDRAEALGFPVPRAMIFEPGADPAHAAQLTFPCIMKPLTKNAAWDARGFKKAYRFDALADFANFATGLKAGDSSVIVQEWIEGGDSDVYFTLLYRDAAGRIQASFTGRKLRQWPPLVGGTASCMPAPEAEPAIADLTARFFAAVNFVGLGSMEYKRDPKAGRYVMVEPTVGRSDYQEEVSTLNGVNVVRAAYRSLAGLQPLPAEPRPSPRIWRDAMGEANSRAAQPDATLPPEAASATVVDAVFRWNDPGPWLADIAARISARLKR
jgi:D-aspartate ligase